MNLSFKFKYILSLILLGVIVTTGMTFSRYSSTYTISSNTLNFAEPDNDVYIIPGTDIEVPDPDGDLADRIEDGEIIIFNDGGYTGVTADDLFSSDNVIIIDNLGELENSSLYVPASVKELEGSSEKPNINWDVKGDIIVEADIAMEGWGFISMLSHSGDIILNDISMDEGDEPFSVDIIAETGGIDANGIEIESHSSSNGKVNLTARESVNIVGAEIESAGDLGINITSTHSNVNAEGATIESENGDANSVVSISGLDINIANSEIESAGGKGVIISSEGDINAEGATIESENGSSNAEIFIESNGSMNLDKANIESKVDITIEGNDNISARSIEIINDQWGKNIHITSFNGTIDISKLTGHGSTKLKSSGDIILKADTDINIQDSNITAEKYNMKIEFEATSIDGGVLYLENATVKGNTSQNDRVSVVNLTIDGQPNSGSHDSLINQANQVNMLMIPLLMPQDLLLGNNLLLESQSVTNGALTTSGPAIDLDNAITGPAIEQDSNTTGPAIELDENTTGSSVEISPDIKGDEDNFLESILPNEVENESGNTNPDDSQIDSTEKPKREDKDQILDNITTQPAIDVSPETTDSAVSVDSEELISKDENPDKQADNNEIEGSDINPTEDEILESTVPSEVTEESENGNTNQDNSKNEPTEKPKSEDRDQILDNATTQPAIDVSAETTDSTNAGDLEELISKDENSELNVDSNLTKDTDLVNGSSDLMLENQESQDNNEEINKNEIELTENNDDLLEADKIDLNTTVAEDNKDSEISSKA